jgi:hypothetical protein
MCYDPHENFAIEAYVSWHSQWAAGKRSIWAEKCFVELSLSNLMFTLPALFEKLFSFQIDLTSLFSKKMHLFVNV